MCTRTLCLPAVLAVVLGTAVPGGVAQAAGDAAAGAEKSTTCAACHGEQGVSEIPTNPVLAGQYPSYIEHALKSYRDGTRQNAIMAGFAAALSDQDIADLAAYFASLDGPLQTAPLD
ncbi:MAG: cytochrome c [Granulosicoccus sp.]|nr:cytochrome c [Granulosicoccus sp.]